MLLFSVGVLCACAILTVAVPAKKAPPSECRSLMDLVFVTDGSDSIAAKDYQQQRLALASILKELDIGPDKARVGIVVYSSTIAQVVPLTGDAALLQKEALHLTHPRDGTHTDLGIAKMIELFKTGGRPNVPWTSIVITDGISKVPTETAAQAANAKSVDVNMYAVGISHFILRDELEAIASSPQQVLELTSFDQLRDSLSKIMKVVCPCPVPPVISHGFVSDGGRAIGTQRTYTCAPGFQPMGNPILECLKNAVWSPLDFSCEACPDPMPVYGNALLVPGTPDDVLTGTQREYICDKGYTSPIPLHITCHESPIGPVWTDMPSLCTSCMEPHLPPFAKPRLTKGVPVLSTLIGDTWVYDCMPGYVATGPMESICMDNMGIPEWTVPAHTCITCTPPPMLPFAMVDNRTDDVLVGSVRSYFCKDGYHPTGPMGAICVGEAGTALWKVAPFECIACMDPVVVPYSRLETKMSHLVGTVLVYSCQQGYQATGPIEQACLAKKGKTFWDGPFNGCVACKGPPVLPHALLNTAGDILVGSIRGYTCDDGYIPSGPIEVGCIEGVGAPLWTDPEFHCITCIHPPKLLRARMLDTGSNLVGGIREYECLPGFVPSVPGFVTVQCLGEYVNNRGTTFWSDPSHACIACPEAPYLENGLPDDGDSLVGTTRYYKCVGGYHATGPIAVTCMDDAVWSTPKHSCKACGPTPDVLNAIALNGSSIIGSIRRYQCAEGLVPDGEPAIKCLPDAHWSPVRFTCTMCKEAYPMANAVLEPGRTVVGEVRAYTCLPGYLETGPIRTTCVSPGQYTLPDWSTPVHSCIDCGDPYAVPFAKALLGPRLIGALQQYECDPGFVPNGPPNSHCMTNAKWTPPAFKCIACGEPPVLAHAIVDTIGGSLVGNVRTYKCDKGYRATGPIELVCTVDLPETFQPPFWYDVMQNMCTDCGIPPTIPNGVWVEGSTTIGTTASYACDEGYSADRLPDIICTDIAEWTPPAFKCTGCYGPPVLPFADIVGYKDGDMMLVGHGYTYLCHKGFPSALDVVVTCQDDLGWSPPSSVCRGCPADMLPGTMFGTAKAPPVKDSPIGTEVLYVCDHGYLPTNTPGVVCQGNLEWSKPLFQCAVTCFDPPVYDDATVDNVGGILEGNVREYKCATGLFTVGDTYIICEPSGKWSTRLFECLVCRDPPIDILANSVSPGPRLFGETVEYQCAPGYTPTGDTFIKCLDGAVWSPLVIGCANCMIPPKLHLADLSLPLSDKGIAVGETIVYSCLPGYVSDSPVSVTCQLDLSWSIPTDVCRGCDPTMIPLIENGAAINIPKDFAAIFHILGYECAKGFLPTSTPEIVCRDSTKWSVPTFHCAKTCYDPDVFDDATVDAVGGILEGDIRTYTCAPGLFTVGDTTIMCEHTGVWTPRAFECRMCRDPPIDILAKAVNPGPRLFGEIVEYQCAPGYTPTGDTFIKCLDGAAWSPLVIGCANCMIPPKLHLADLSLPLSDKGIAVSETIVYSCLPGYVSASPVSVTCQLDLSWSIPTDMCRGCDPTMVPLIENGAAINIPKDFAAIFHILGYECAKGFLPTSTPEIVCHDSTKWSVPTFQCAKTCYDPTVFDDATVDAVGGILEGDVRTYTCAPGLFTVGDTTIMCEQTGVWTPRKFECRMCEDPPMDILATAANPGPRLFGETVNYQCAPGYTPTGDTFIKCLDGAVWSPLVIGCANCMIPPKLHLADLSLPLSDKGIAVSETIMYSCLPGYVSDLPVSVTCQPDLSWSIPTDVCRGCDPTIPPLIENGDVINPANDFLPSGHILLYQCAKGFLPTSTPEIPCLDSTKWDVPAFHCAKTCFDPPVFDDAKIDNAGGILEGDVRTYTCAPGLFTFGDTNIICEPTGVWSPRVFECLMCTNPPTDDLAMALNPGPRLFGEVVEYQCASGYKPTGNAFIKCLEGAVWSPLTIGCANCRFPPKVHLAESIVPLKDNGVLVGDTLFYNCLPGYVSSVPVSIKCQLDLSWSKPTDMCRGCDPGLIPLVHNAAMVDVYKDLVPIGTKTTFQCAPGHIPSNIPEIECRHDTKWSIPTFMCEMSCGDPPVYKDATVDLIGGIMLRDERVYTCNLGLQPVGNVVLMCLPNGQWTTRKFECKMCMNPPMVAHAFAVNPGPRMLGEAVEYICGPGYAPTGDPFISCLIGAVWSQSVIGCSKCGLPPKLPYSLLAVVPGDDDTLVGSSVSYMCDVGYKSIAPVTSTCQPDLTWSLASTLCRGCMKDDAPIIDHGIVSGTLDKMCSIGYRLTYTCEVGYLETDTADVECKDDYSWTVPKFRCAISCGAPPAHPDANVDLIGNIYEGSVRKYSCNAGLLTVGDDSVMCMGTGLWTDLMMECKKCGPPPELEFAVPLDQTSFIGTVVSYKCKQGSISKGHVTSICETNLTWSTPFNKCFDCGLPPDVPNAVVQSGSSAIGSIREYQCRNDFDLPNDIDAVITCLPNGHWSQPGFICIPKKMYIRRPMKTGGYQRRPFNKPKIVGKPFVTQKGYRKNPYGRRTRRKFRRRNRNFRRMKPPHQNMGLGLMVELDDVNIAPVFPVQPTHFRPQSYPDRRGGAPSSNLSPGMFMHGEFNSEYRGRPREVPTKFKVPKRKHKMNNFVKPHPIAPLWHPSPLKMLPAPKPWHKAPMKWYPSRVKWHKAHINMYPSFKKWHSAPIKWHNAGFIPYPSLTKWLKSPMWYPALTGYHIPSAKWYTAPDMWQKSTSFKWHPAATSWHPSPSSWFGFPFHFKWPIV